MEHILHATDLVMDYSTQQATPNAAHMLALNHVDFGIQAGESKIGRASCRERV